MSAPIDAPAAPVPLSPSPIVDDLCSYLERLQERRDVSQLCDFARLFFARVPRPLVQERSLEQLAALTVGAFELLGRGEPDRAIVQVRNPEEEGWEAPVTIIRAVLGDRPFVVDTMREYLSAEKITIHHFMHPVIGVRRTARGKVVAVTEPGEDERNHDLALVHCEISRIQDPNRREVIGDEIERRLGDVIAATDDFPAMLEALEATIAAVEGYAQRLPERRGELEEIFEFLHWLRQGNFVFLGFRSYDITGSGKGEERELHVEPGTGLGILRRESESAYAHGVPLSELSEGLRRRVTGGPLLIISKSNAEATVHRRSRMDYVGIKKLDAEGQVVGERRFLGLFTSKAYAENAESIPILRHKLQRILQGSGAPPGSHDYKEIITIFNSMPKEDLFQASVTELGHEVQTVLTLLFADEVRVTLRPDPLGRGISAMVVLPRGKFSSEVRNRIQEMLTRRLDATVLNYYLAISAGDQARLHFYLSAPPGVVERADPHEIERQIVQIIRSWEDRLLDECVEAYPAGDAQRLVRRFAPSFSEEYRAANAPAVALHDIEQLQWMEAEELDVAIDLRTPPVSAGSMTVGVGGVTILKLYLRNERLVLSDFMPILENAGLRVIDVTPFTVEGPQLPSFMIYSFAVQGPEGRPLPLERAPALAEAILAVRRGDTANDGLNALVLTAGLRWREVDVLRTYANYVFQIGAVPSRISITRALIRNPDVARLVFELFRMRFDPQASQTLPSERLLEAIDALRGGLSGALQEVSALADDRALRRLCNVLEATVRTNYYRHGAADPTFTSGGAPYISLKIRSADIEELRRSRLLYEIFVFSARMEGIHLRAAPVSRGGIRWSDRPDDFRTEVMGLVQTQIVKNAVIVPAGSKGGFITKRFYPDRDEMMREAAEQYRTLIRGMLDVTDNLVAGEVVPPPAVVRHDQDDPYLVVAADKGTAHLSDAANAVAAEYDFWLGDAFASGGSHGYDHKKEGITARGAWECVRRHFREMGKDIQSEPFTVIGVGDMSGDVFGNGMLLSRQIRLIAAFDHRHIFIDPDPDPETCYRERERLFQLPRSSWDDYDRTVLSPGGMIVPRASKEVQLTPEARLALGLDPAAERMDGEALIRAVLRAPAELLWNGGIGTYVKDVEETHAEVGDTSNDPVRVDADELRCKVVGEGGNLGFTQRARIRFALRGGRINTDAIDNSGGVDMSDHEVNLKILMGPQVQSGAMSFEDRNRLLEEMTDEVSHLVLKNNLSQSLAVSLDEERSREALGDFSALITAFERDRLLERGTEGIPSSDALHERAEAGLGLMRPTLCVLLAYAKLHAESHLLASTLPDDPATEPYLMNYFPRAAVEAAGIERLRAHRLRREIITNELSNELVDLMGSSFLHHAARDTGSDIPSVVRAWMIASLLAGAAALRGDLARLEGELPTRTVYRWYFGLARVLERTSRWVLANIASDVPTSAVLEQHLDGLIQLRVEFGRLVTGQDREIFESLLEEIQPLGLHPTLAERIITLRFLPQLLDIVRIAQEAEADAVATARAYYLVSERFASAELRQAVQLAARDDPWEKRHALALAEDVDRAHRCIARAVLAASNGDAGEGLEAALGEFEEHHIRDLRAYREVLQEIRTGERVPLAGYAVAARLLGEVAGA